MENCLFPESSGPKEQQNNFLYFESATVRMDKSPECQTSYAHDKPYMTLVSNIEMLCPQLLNDL